MRNTTLKKIGKPLLQIGLPIAIAVFFLYKVKDYNWQILTADAARWNYWLLAVSFLGFILQELSFGLIWQSVLKRLGYHLDLRVCLRIYLASEFVRYIPGNVWHVLTRVLWTGKYGVPRPIAFASMTVELITKLAAGAIVFALSLLFWGSANALGSLFQSSLILVIGGVSFIALLVVLHPRILNGLLNLALGILKRDPVTLSLRYRDILLVTLMWCASWFVAGCAFYVMLLALWPATPLAALPVCIGIYAIAWDFGFVTFITPSGLGFRELAIGVLFALALPFVPGAVVAVIALLSRVVSTLAELLCVSVAYLSGGKQVRAVQQEQMNKPASSPPELVVAEQDVAEENADLASEAPAPDMV
ncbi:MAG TPA: lysylphosphatidylglycerol synthase transmembrane domain-containing protein [Ktedonobacteraceae bacterium]|nr:lysylphosphatidylglycerol synthase transmembrane domain-containing protein [Ktedonobacteraceae bacterium]